MRRDQATNTDGRSAEKLREMLATSRAIRGLDPRLRHDGRESIAEKVRRWQRLRTPDLSPRFRQLTEYDPAWAELFADEKAKILATFDAGEVIDVEHFGSTAIPSLPAKRIVDLFVVFRDPVVSALQRKGLERLGYEDYGNSPCDPQAYWFWKIAEPTGCLIAHIVERSNPWPQQAIDFRDFLCAHPDERARYDRAKRRLAAEAENSLLAYSIEKLKLFYQICDRATAWRRRAAAEPAAGPPAAE